MNYYLGTEFHEYHRRHRCLGIKVGKPVPAIDLISIGIVSEDGREYYAVSKDFDIKAAWNSWLLTTKDNIPHKTIPRREYWLRDNILKPIFIELVHSIFFTSEVKKYVNIYYEFNVSKKGISDTVKKNMKFTLRNFKRLIKKYGKTNKQIADEIKAFVYYTGWEVDPPVHHHKLKEKLPINFYGYYSGYDLVVLEQLFGGMKDYPAAFPKYIIDLKQMLDEKAEVLMTPENINKITPNTNIRMLIREMSEKGVLDIDEKIKILKEHSRYPKQKNEHNALDDALFNKKLHNFLKTL